MLDHPMVPSYIHHGNRGISQKNDVFFRFKQQEWCCNNHGVVIIEIMGICIHYHMIIHLYIHIYNPLVIEPSAMEAMAHLLR